MRNNYPGTCYRCGQQVAANEGHFERCQKSHQKKWGVNLRGWLIQHADCAIKYRGTDIHYRYKPPPQPPAAKMEGA
jgi:hypothetical protein